MSEAIKEISELCTNDFYRSSTSKKLLVFLPAVNGKNIYPYFPRISWANSLVDDYNVLYLSDPYQQLLEYQEPMGSWFISPDGSSSIKTLAQKIDSFRIEIGADDVIFYGSSMGGYAAIILSALVSGSKAIAECPQLYLNQHPGSRFVCNNILDRSTPVEDIEPLHFLLSGKSAHIRLVCSVYDRHFTQHILPFMEDITNKLQLTDTSIILEAYSDPTYQKGHVALRKADAIRLIEDVAKI